MKKVFLTLAVVLATSTVLVSCGGKKEASENATVEATTEEVAAPEEAPAASEEATAEAKAEVKAEVDAARRIVAQVAIPIVTQVAAAQVAEQAAAAQAAAQAAEQAAAQLIGLQLGFEQYCAARAVYNELKAKKVVSTESYKIKTLFLEAVEESDCVTLIRIRYFMPNEFEDMIRQDDYDVLRLAVEGGDIEVLELLRASIPRDEFVKKINALEISNPKEIAFLRKSPVFNACMEQGDLSNSSHGFFNAKAVPSGDACADSSKPRPS
jgi:hypothetical protein